MVYNYFKIAVRSFLKDKAYSFINVLGLAVGMICALFISLYIWDELRYDNFHENQNIYRVALHRTFSSNQVYYATTPSPMAEVLEREYPEIEAATRLFKFNNDVRIRHDDKIFFEPNILAADSNFFSVFSIKLLKGNAEEVLKLRNSVVLTESSARKYFGNEDPVGKSISVFSDTTLYMVTGVTEDVPSNCHFKFDMLFSFVTFPLSESPSWAAYTVYNYVILDRPESKAVLESKFEKLVEQYFGPEVQTILGKRYEEYVAAGNHHYYHLQPIADIHLHSNYQSELQPNGDIRYIYLFSAVCVFILFIAAVNFTNLSTARSFRRAKEIGIRKVHGSLRIQIIAQFLAESIIASLLSVTIALVCLFLLLPAFNELSGKQISFSDVSFALMMLAVLALILINGILAGLYPAFVISAFEPVKIFKNNQSPGRKSGMRNVLVIIQFGLSVFLIICTFAVYNQLQFMQSRKLGFDKEHILVIERTNNLGTQYEAFSEELRQMPGVLSVSGAFTVPGRQFSGATLQPVGAEATERINHSSTFSDFYLPEALGLDFVAGRTFSRDHAGDSLGVVVNESLIKRVGWKSPVEAIGQKIRAVFNMSVQYEIIGVVKDFHFESLHSAIEPLVMYPAGAQGFAPNLAVVRLQSGTDLRRTASMLEYRWKKFLPGELFEYSFLEEEFNTLYAQEVRLGKIFTLFSFLAIFIASIGVIGISTFITRLRVKEIGIRKVNGATVPGLIMLLAKDFLKLVLIANLIFWPLTWFGIKEWLKNYPYQEGVGFWVFFVTGILTALIVLLSVIWQSAKASLANPVKALRSE